MELESLPKLSAKAEEILDIIGSADEATINAILATGATYGEIQKAFEWEEEEEYIGEGPEKPEGRIKDVYDILKDSVPYQGKPENNNYEY